MKKVLTLFVLCFMFVGLYGQGKKITELPVVTSAVDASLLMIRSGASGNTISQITKSNFMSNVDDYIVDTVDVGEVAPLLTDTMLYFAPTIGAGNANDTTLFSYGDVLFGFKWEGSHSLVITKVTGVVYGTTPDIDVALLYDANFRDATPTTVFSSDLTITSTTTGNEATINASNDTITSGIWVWVRVDQCTAQPTQCIINIYGYLE